MKKVFFAFVFLFSAQVLALPPDMADKKYERDYIIAIIIRAGSTIPSVNDGRPVTIDSLIEFKYETYSLLDAPIVFNQTMDTFAQFFSASSIDNPLSAFNRCAMVAKAESYNASMYSLAMGDYQTDFRSSAITSAEQVTSVQKNIDLCRTANEGGIRELQRQVDIIVKSISGNGQAVKELAEQIQALSQKITSGTATPEDKANLATAQGKYLGGVAIEGAKGNASGFLPISINVGANSAADNNYTNMVKSLCAWLGAVDGGSVTNNGMTFAAPAVDGEATATMLQFLGVNGVIVLSTNDFPQTAWLYGFKINLNGDTEYATFRAPITWAGEGLVVTNGAFALAGNGAWNYVNGAFHNCEVRIGSSTSISESEIQYGTAGSVYAVITYGGNGDASLTLSPTPDNEFGVKISVKVGELVQNESVEAGDAGLRNTYQYDGSIIINCYE